MEFKIYIKNKQKYELRKIIPAKNSNQTFFKSLLLRIDNELKNIRNDIISFFDNPDDVYLIRPRHPDWDIQKKIDKLVDMRTQNIKIKTLAKELIQDREFIICECGGRMYKTPLNVPFKKYGKSYIIRKEYNHNVKYSYMCESCVRSMSKEIYQEAMNLKKRRKELLDKGYNWVPNDENFWYWYDNGKPLKKHPDNI